jgi:hypothetical protein
MPFKEGYGSVFDAPTRAELQNSPFIQVFLICLDEPFPKHIGIEKFARTGFDHAHHIAVKGSNAPVVPASSLM